MGYIELQKDGKSYGAEYHLFDNLLTMHGERGTEQIQLNGMAEHLAAKTVLRTLIRKGHIDPTEGNLA